MDTDEKQGTNSHLLLDCYNCSKEKLSDPNFIYKVLDSLPEKIGLTKIAPPSVFQYQGNNPDTAGISGVVRIAQSHISLHTFPDNRHVFIDVFSCQDFDTNLARSEILKIFEAAQ